MPQFRYNALSTEGQPLAGTIRADTRPEAIDRLTRDGAYVTDITTTDSADPSPQNTAQLSVPAPTRRRVTLRAKSEMLEQLAVALQAGLPLLEALQVVSKQADNAALAAMVDDLARRVQAGESLSQAMAENRPPFYDLDIAMATVGETAGKLDEVMGYLAQFAQHDLETRQRIKSAAAYPLFLLALAVVSIVVILTWILPRVMGAVIDQGGAIVLPWPTRVLMSVSDFLRSPGGVLLFAICLFSAWLYRRWVATPEGRLTIDQFKLKLPVLGTAFRKIAVARFARTLGTLSRAGIPILEAMHVLRGTLGNEALAQQLDQVTAEITQGQSIAEPLRKTGQFPPLLIQVIAMGERTGKLDELLLRAADSLEKDTDATLARVMTLLPAVFIVCMAMLVLFILAAVLLPIMNMDAAISAF